MNPPAPLARIAPPLLCLALAVAASPAWGQPPPLVTDRPDQTESSDLVPPRQFQIEVGYTHARNDDGGVETTTDTLPQALLRFGVNDRFELRFGIDGYNWIDTAAAGSGSTRASGFGDISIGIKSRLWDERGSRPAAALIGSLGLPTGERGFSSERIDPAARVTFSSTLTERLSLGYNAGAAWRTTETSPGVAETLSVAEWTVALGIGATERLGFFVEAFGEAGLSAGGGPANSLDGGLTWLFRDHLQFDVAVGAGLSEAADDWFAGVGLSYRHPN